MLENGRLNGSLGQIKLDFVEREATPAFLMKLSISYICPASHFRILFKYLRYSVSSVLDLRFITGFTRPVYSRSPTRTRITLRLMRQ